MDFGAILSKAQKNEVDKKGAPRYYSTKFAPPKKEQKNNKQLSVNIQKFLAKKEEEEKKKRLEAQRKRDELLALRAKDKKATKRVSVMLKRTKSANQSVIEDAVDSTNTAVTLAGGAQPDEDDYGYVSQEASALYNKMMEKYSKMPEEQKFGPSKKIVSTNLTGTKDRVKAALERERLEALMPHKRKRKHKETSEEGPSEESKKEELEEEIRKDVEVKKEKPKPKFKAPPPMNFMDLLKIAEKKQFEPIVIEQKPKEEEKLLTKKQKKEMEREMEYRNRRLERERNPNATLDVNNTPQKQPKSDNQSKDSRSVENRIPKSNNSVQKVVEQQARPSSSVPNKNREQVSNYNKEKKPPGVLTTSKSPKELAQSQRSANINQNKAPIPMSNKKPSTPNTPRSLPESVKSNGSSLTKKSLNSTPQRPNGMTASKSNITPVQKKFDGRPSSSTNRDFDKPKSMNSRPMSKLENPRDPKFRRPEPEQRKGPSKLVLSNNKRRIVDEDDEEYDSEMDDFIDDGPEGGEDYSSIIGQIFNYNKSKYRYDEDDDDANMESSFAQQMKEEVISAKIGIMEDLEDMKLEEQHKKRKAMIKKQKRD